MENKIEVNASERLSICSCLSDRAVSFRMIFTSVCRGNCWSSCHV